MTMQEMVDALTLVKGAQWVLLVAMFYAVVSYCSVSCADQYGRYVYIPAVTCGGMAAALLGVPPVPAMLRVGVEVTVIALSLWGIRNALKRGLSGDEQYDALQSIVTAVLVPVILFALALFYSFAQWLSRQPGWWN